MRTAGRLLTVGSVVAAAGTGLLAMAGPAGAATISAPSVITTPSTVTITATTDAVQGAKLLFDGTVVASTGPLQLGSTLSYRFSTSPLRNGSYPVALNEQVAVLPWHTAKTATIVLRIPPAPPSGVSARLVSGRTVKVSWARGAEPDLTSYDVVSSAGGGASGLGVGSACGSGACSATLTMPGTATSVGFAVVAHRSNGAGGTLASGASPTAYVSVPAPGGSSVGGGRGAGGSATGSGYGAVTAGGAGGAAGGYGNAYTRFQGLSGESPALVLPTVGPQSGLALPISGTKAAQSRHAEAWRGVWYSAVAALLILLLIAAHAGAWTRRRRRVPRPSAAAPVTAVAAPAAQKVAPASRKAAPSVRAAARENGAASQANGEAGPAAARSNRRRNGRHTRDLSPANRAETT